VPTSGGLGREMKYQGDRESGKTTLMGTVPLRFTNPCKSRNFGLGQSEKIRIAKSRLRRRGDGEGIRGKRRRRNKLNFEWVGSSGRKSNSSERPSREKGSAGGVGAIPRRHKTLGGQKVGQEEHFGRNQIGKKRGREYKKRGETLRTGIR